MRVSDSVHSSTDMYQERKNKQTVLPEYESYADIHLNIFHLYTYVGGTSFVV